MISRLSSVLVAALMSTVAIAAPSGGKTSSCNYGQINCCNEVQNANALDSSSQSLLDRLLGNSIGQITGNIGFGCAGVNVIGVGGDSKCTGQQVCCTGNNFSGTVVLGCTPLNIAV